VAQNAGECGRVVIFQFDRVLFALLAKMLALHSPSMKITTHSEATVRPAHLSEVLILSTHDYLVYLNFGTIAELDGQVGVGAFVEPLAGVHDGQGCLVGSEWRVESLCQKRDEQREVINIK
jgi:hypothetical protein